MRETPRSITWDAPEHYHREKSNDWYWIVGIFTVAASVVSIIMGNLLFAIIIIIGTSSLALVAYRPPKIREYEVSVNHLRIDDEMYLYPTLDSFFIDTTSLNAPQLIVKPKAIFSSLLFFPLPEEHIDTIDDIVAPRLYEEHLEEPLGHQLLEILGF